MALLSYGTAPSKGATTTVTLDKTELAALSADPWWQDWENLSQAIITVKSTTGKSKITLIFDLTQSPCTAQMAIPLNTRDEFEINKVVLLDSLGDKLSVSRTALVAAIPSVSSLDLDLGVPGPDVVPPEGATLYIANASPGLQVSFGAAADNVTDSGNITYKLYYIYSVNQTAPLTVDLATIESSFELLTTLSGGGAFNHDFILQSAPSQYGGHNYFLVYEDEAGNKSVLQDQYYLLDTLPPNFTILALNQSTTPIGGLDFSFSAYDDNMMGQIEFRAFLATSEYSTNLQGAIDNATEITNGWTLTPGGSYDETLFAPTYPLVNDPPTEYFVTVFIRDLHGNETSGFANATTQLIDVTAPDIQSFSASNPTYSSIDLGVDATDNDPGSAGFLEYKYLYSESNNLSTILDAETNGTIISDWSLNAGASFSAPVSGTGTTYYFAVLVRDLAGNIAIATTSEAILVEDLASPTIAQFSVEWASDPYETGSDYFLLVEGSDNISAPGNISYSFYEVDSVVSSVEGVENTGTLLYSDVLGSTNTASLPYLPGPGFGVYTLGQWSGPGGVWYAVILQDETGNKSWAKIELPYQN
jgi:hypothetical protein